MAAGLGFKTFAVGEVLSAANVNGYLMQGVLVFANATARDAAITSPQEGQFAYLKDTNVTTYYTGSAWANLDTTGMTNPMTTTGDTIYSSSGSTPARLGIGSTGNVLTVAGGVPTWAAPAGGGALTLITSGTFTTSSTVTIDSIFTSTYTNYKLIINVNSTTNAGANYCTGNFRTSGTPNTNASYNEIVYGRNEDNTAQTRNTTSETSMRFGYIGNSTSSFIEQNFYNPQASQKTYYSGFSGLTGLGAATFQGAFNNTTAFDGFEFSPFSGNCTGTYAVYGFQKS
jgi:hypothetical protein